MLTGAITNAVAIVIGGIIGTKAGKLIPKRHSDLILVCLEIVVLVLGIGFAIKSANILIVVISLVIGGLIGESIDIDGRMQKLGDAVQKKLKTEGAGIPSAFVATTLIYCVGSMAILASIESGIQNQHSIHYAKAIIDGLSAIFFASTMGIGVSLSAVPVLLYQGTLTLLAGFVAPYVTNEIMTEVSATGGVLLIALALSMLDIKKIKVANLIPALIVPVFLILSGLF